MKVYKDWAAYSMLYLVIKKQIQVLNVYCLVTETKFLTILLYSL
jgi:hypothetical protein